MKKEPFRCGFGEEYGGDSISLYSNSTPTNTPTSKCDYCAGMRGDKKAMAHKESNMPTTDSKNIAKEINEELDKLYAPSMDSKNSNKERLKEGPCCQNCWASESVDYIKCPHMDCPCGKLRPNTTNTGWEQEFDRAWGLMPELPGKEKIKQTIKTFIQHIEQTAHTRGKKEAVEFIRANSSFIRSENQKLHKISPDGKWDEGHELEGATMYQVWERTLEAALTNPKD